VRPFRYTLALHGTRILTIPVDLHLSHHRTKPDEAKKIRQNGECSDHDQGWERTIKNTAKDTCLEKRRGRKRARKDMGYERGRGQHLESKAIKLDRDRRITNRDASREAVGQTFSGESLYDETRTRANTMNDTAI
jgi:hypothetical protein